MNINNYKNNNANGFNSGWIVCWDKKYSTGIVFIDNHHRELVRLTNQLYQACLGGDLAFGMVFKDAMSQMVDYVRFHFGVEQQLLEQIGYPNYKDRKMQHTTLVKNILCTAKDYSDGKKFVANSFVRTLKDWIFGHIAVSDNTYAAYVAEQKAKGLICDYQLNG